jgi:hypothetical protein
MPLIASMGLLAGTPEAASATIRRDDPLTAVC